MSFKQKNIKQWLVLLALLINSYHPSLAQDSRQIKTDWKLAVQSYTFHKFTLMEALDKVKELGVPYIEVYPGHRLGAGFGDLSFLPSLSIDVQKRIVAEAKKRGVKIIAMGVVVLNETREWESYFSFAKKMGMEYITAEPAIQDWNIVEGLVKKYDIKLAVHNHPKPSLYWNPTDLLQVISKRDKRIGACADVGHWKREGLEPLACLKTLNGRILSLHFKDITNAKVAGHEMPDTIWGTGILPIKDLLYELKRQQFNGTLAIEYENNWNNSVPDIKKNLNYYYAVLKEINKL